MGERLCEMCDQPMLPPGETKRPDEYDHARGCPLAPTPPEDDASLDSPPFTPAALTEFAARGYERVNRPAEDDAAREARAWLDEWDSGEWVEERVSTLLPSLTEFLRDRVRAAERRGYDRGLEEAAKECDPDSFAPWDGTPAACARRIRALRERAGGST